MGDYDATLTSYANEIKNKAADKKIEVQQFHAGQGAAGVQTEQIRHEINARIEPLFNPFYGMPNPAIFNPPIQQIQQSMSMLSTGEMDSKDPLDKYAVLPANQQMNWVKTSSDLLLADWDGAAASNFKSQFASNFPGASKNHFILMSAMKATMTAQQSMWRSARDTVNDMHKKTIDAIESISPYCPNTGQVSFMFSVLSSVAALAAVPGANILVGVVAAAGAVGSTAAGAGKAFAGPAPTVDAVLDHLVKGVNKLLDDVRETEKKIVGGLQGFTDKINSPDTRQQFTLPRPALADMRGKPDEVAGPGGLGESK